MNIACLEGHADHEGRLDLLIRFGDRAIIVIEVKLGGRESADTDKHSGYCQWIKEQNCSESFLLLVATSARGSLRWLSFCLWATVCIELRRLAIEIRKAARMTTAAMVLAFAAAVEQNLLGFSSQTVKHILAGNCTRLFNVEIVKHLETFIRRLDS